MEVSTLGVLCELFDKHQAFFRAQFLSLSG